MESSTRKLSRPVFFTPLTKAVMVLGFAAILFELSNIGDTGTQATLQLLVNSFIYMAMGIICYRLTRIPGEKAVRRFWFVAGVSNVSRGFGDLVQVLQISFFSVPNPEVQTAVVKGIYAIGLLIVAREFVFYPLAAKNARERTRLLLDLLTVMIAVAGFGWFFILAPTFVGPFDTTKVLMAVSQFGMVLIYANFVKLLLSNTQLLTRRSNILALFAVIGYCVSDALVPVLGGSDYVFVILICKLATGIINFIAIRNQEYDLLCDAQALQKKKRKPYSLVPYTAMAGLYLVLVVSMVQRSSLGIGTWGLMVTAVLVTAVVVVRQLNAFADNAKLLKQLDDNLHELQESYDREQESNRARAQLEIELRHAQKLDALGRLAGGVAHEINTPVQYLKDNLAFLSDGFKQLVGLVDGCRNGRHVTAETAPDVDFLVEEVPMALHDATSGLNRVAEIVRSMKSFGGGDAGDERVICNVNDIIADTLVISRSQVDPIAEVSFEQGELPQIVGNVRDLGQVWLNLLLNSISAIESKGLRRGDIHIVTDVENDNIVVQISDNGMGMTDEVADHAFDPFFTTKAVGVGTGQGLTVARSIIVEGHGGDIDFETEYGVGTKFSIMIPVSAVVKDGSSNPNFVSA